MTRRIDGVEYYSRAEVDAALCCWEAFSEALHGVLGDDYRRYAEAYREANGAAQIRDNMIDIGEDIEDAWQDVSDHVKEYMPPFDWEIVPGVMFEILKECYYSPTATSYTAYTVRDLANTVVWREYLKATSEGGA